MKFPYFTGSRTAPVEDNQIPVLDRAVQTNPENYDTDPFLADAVNTALLINQPLLLTGDPGTGKTQLAYRVAWELNYDPPLKFETKSNTKSQDLFYYYHSLARFHDAQFKRDKGDASYITYNALGLAILRGNPHERYRHLLPQGLTLGEPRRSVVLIDEIDKAPRDFPNDILNEIENMYFRIPELDNAEVRADPAFTPVVIITSNSEKDLPDTFMRRCVFYHIEFPTEERMRRIVENRLRDIPKEYDPDRIRSFLNDAVDLFFEIRDPRHGIRKMPATAELLAWLLALNNVSPHANPLRDDPDNALRTVGTLMKNKDDLNAAKGVLSAWQSRRKP